MIDVNEAYKIFLNYVGPSPAEIITDLGDLYIIANCRRGDFVNEAYKIDKKTGVISDLDFLEYLSLDLDTFAIEYNIDKNGTITKCD